MSETVDLTGGATRAPAPDAGQATQAGQVSQASIGQLLSEVTQDLSTLMRQEVELAKAEIKQEATKAATGAGMLGGGAFAGYFALLFLSIALMYLINLALPLGWAAAIVGALYAALAAGLALAGKKKLSSVSPAPTQTIDTLKEDAQWAKHPTR